MNKNYGFVSARDQNSSATTAIARRDFKSVNDQTLRKTFKEMKQHKEQMTELNKVIKKTLELPQRRRGVIAKILHFLVPRKFYGYMPNRLVDVIAEEYDAVFQIEGMQRDFLNNTLDTTRNLFFCTVAKREELEELKQTIATAEKENWDAMRLREFLVEKSKPREDSEGIAIPPEVQDLFLKEFESLSSAEKETRRKRVFGILKSGEKTGEKSIETMNKFCSLSEECFDLALQQYYLFVSFLKPVIAIRDASEALSDANQGMYAARDAIVVTLETSIDTIDAVTNAMALVEQYSLSNPEVVKRLESGTRRIEKNVLRLRSIDISGLENRKNTGEVIDVEAEEVKEVKQIPSTPVSEAS